ncbi:MAG: flagellar biosynthetic protein FliO [Vibrio sp.]
MKKRISLLLIPFPAWADTAQPGQFDMATGIGSLLFVLALIVFLGWLLKRMRVPTMGQQKGLRIVRQIPVGTKERIMIIEAGGEQFLVGSTTQSIQLISKLEQPLTEEEAAMAPFAQQFTRLLKKHDNTTSK